MNQPAFTPYNAMLFFITSFGMRYTPRSEALPVQSVDEDEEGRLGNLET